MGPPRLTRIPLCADGTIPENDFEAFGWNLPDPDHIVTIETDFTNQRDELVVRQTDVLIETGGSTQ